MEILREQGSTGLLLRGLLALLFLGRGRLKLVLVLSRVLVALRVQEHEVRVAHNLSAAARQTQISQRRQTELSNHERQTKLSKNKEYDKEITQRSMAKLAKGGVLNREIDKIVVEELSER